KSLAGMASATFKHGRRSRYAKHLSGELKAGYEAALQDDKLTSLADELALLTVRASQLLDRLKDAEQPPWGSVVESLNDLVAAAQAGDEDQLHEALERHAQVVRTGAAAATTQERTWNELRQVIGERTKTATAEWRRMSDVGALVKVLDVQLFVRMVMEA